MGIGGNIPSGCEGAGDRESGRGRGERRIRDGAIGEDGQELKTGDIT